MDQTTPGRRHHSCSSVKKTFKHCVNQKSRTNALKLGHLERLVLVYATRVSETFTPSDVVVYYKLKDRYGEDARKRVYDTIKRLTERGLLVRVSRGVYRLNADVPVSAVEQTGSRVLDVKDSLGGAPVERVLGDFVIRFHVRGGGGVVGFYVRLLVAKRVLDTMVRVFEGEYMYRVYGRSFCRRVRSFVRRSVRLEAVVAGVHGRVGSGGGEFSPLLPLTYVDFGYFQEIGLDAVGQLPVDKLFAKLYVVPVSKSRSILEYARAVTGWSG